MTKDEALKELAKLIQERGSKPSTGTGATAKGGRKADK
jgi:hypothetical protein